MYTLSVFALYKPGTTIKVDDDELTIDWIEILENGTFYHFKSDNPDYHIKMRADYLDNRISENIKNQ